MNILVIEDEKHIAAGLKLNLELEGFEATVCHTARDGLEAMLHHAFDVVLLDVMLPDMSGFVVCEKLRKAGHFLPVIMLTAKSDPQDRVNGLDVGADDYVSKPFDFQELVARIRSAARRQHWDRSEQAVSSEKLRFGDAFIDLDTHEVLVDGKEIKLTQLEFDLIKYFYYNVGRVLSREELLEHVWKLRNYPNTRTVDNFIVRLRKHFERDPKRPRHFLSQRGSGYKFVRDP